MRRSQSEESWDILGRGSSMCKCPEMGQTLVSSRNKTRSKWISRAGVSVSPENSLEMQILRPTLELLTHRPGVAGQ